MAKVERRHREEAYRLHVPAHADEEIADTTDTELQTWLDTGKNHRFQLVLTAAENTAKGIAAGEQRGREAERAWCVEQIDDHLRGRFSYWKGALRSLRAVIGAAERGEGSDG